MNNIFNPVVDPLIQNPNHESDSDFEFDFSDNLVQASSPAKKHKNHIQPHDPQSHEPIESAQETSQSKPNSNHADPDKLYQTRYHPASKLPPTGGLIPSSLASAVKHALDRFINQYGPVDDYVMSALGKDFDDLGKCFSAEQVDAIALCLSAMLRGDEPILSDVTGFGKGRVLAAVAMGLMLAGHNIIFMTQSSNLFTDFWRDVRNIGGEGVFGIPYIMNSDGDSKIIDMNNRLPDGRPIVIHKHIKANMTNLSSHGWPKNPSILMMTYSQMNRRDSEKAAIATSLAENAFVICDESHNTVTPAQSGVNTREIKMVAKGRISASATYGRDIQEMATYSGTMPWLSIMSGISGVSLRSLHGPARRALEEASSTKAALLGLLLRREHDMTDIVMEAIDATDRIGVSKSAEIEDKFSQIAKKLASIWSKTNSVAKSLPRGAYPSAKASNFGGTYAILNKQFSLSMMLPVAASEAERIALDGQRYVGIIDSTQESLLKMIKESRDDIDNIDGIKISDNPTFRDAIKIAAHRMRLITSKSKDDNLLICDEPSVIKNMSQLMEMIEGFPDLPISPLDYMKYEIERRGKALYDDGKISAPWRVGEISGRETALFDDGRIGPYNAQPRGDVIYAFNNGGDAEITHLLLTRAAAVGMSLHDSVENQISMPRHMQEIQPPSNVVDRAQIWGRIGRRGTRTKPKYSALYLSMPGDIYTVVSQAKKISRISAVVSGSSETLRMLQNMPDPIDRAGDIAAAGLLADNPGIARALMIGMEDQDEHKQEGSEFSNIYPILRRIRLLPFVRQRHVFDMLMERREETLSAFPREEPVLSGIWVETSRRQIDPGFDGGSPLYAGVFESERSTPPIESTRLRIIIKSLLPKQNKPSERREVIVNAAKPDLMALAQENNIPSVSKAISSPGANPVKERWAIIKSMLDITDMTPGGVISVPAEHGEKNNAILVSITLRDKAQPLLPRAYRIEYVCPGDDSIKSISLDRIIKSGCGPVDMGENQSKMSDVFDQAVSQSKKIRKSILIGDPIDEVMASIRIGGGTRSNFMVADKNGNIHWQHGVALPKHLINSIDKMSYKIVDTDIAFRALHLGINITTSLKSSSYGGIIFLYDKTRYGYYIDYQSSDSVAANAVFSIAKIDNSVAEKYGHRSYFIQKNSNMEFIMRNILQSGIPLFCDPRFRKIINESVDNEQNSTAQTPYAA